MPQQNLVELIRQQMLTFSIDAFERALPGPDGLKPVQRRALYAAFKAGLKPTVKHKKCSYVVGSTLAAYHPHGENSVYGTLVLLAQSFATRYPLFDPQGNFGSLYGDPAAAYRYTECRLSTVGFECFKDIDFTDFQDNYDQTTLEPKYLPVPLPVGLLNGYGGIASGFAGRIPPHNLKETVEALIALIDNSQIDNLELIKHLRGPDYASGGILVSSEEEIRNLYLTGKGSLKYRCKWVFENNNTLVITELAPGLSFETLRYHKELAKLEKSGNLIVEDESSKKLRLVIRFADTRLFKKIEPLLYSTIYYSFLMVNEDDKIEHVTLMTYLKNFLNLRVKIVVRRLQALLKDAQIDLKKIEAKLALINAKNFPTLLTLATEDLIVAELQKLSLDQEQIDYLLQTPLRQLLKTANNQTNLLAKQTELNTQVVTLTQQITNPLPVIKEELKAFSKAYGDSRRTAVRTSAQSIEAKGVVAFIQLHTDGGLIKTSDAPGRLRLNTFVALAKAKDYVTILFEDAKLKQSLTYQLDAAKNGSAPIALFGDDVLLIAAITEDSDGSRRLVIRHHRQESRSAYELCKHPKIIQAVGLRLDESLALLYTDDKHESVEVLDYHHLLTKRAVSISTTGWRYPRDSRSRDKKYLAKLVVIPVKGTVVSQSKGTAVKAINIATDCIPVCEKNFVVTQSAARVYTSQETMQNLQGLTYIYPLT